MDLQFASHSYFSCRTIRSKKFKMDSIAISVQVRFGTSAYECEMNEEEMKYHPVRLEFEHFDKATSNRKLLAWADDEVKTDVSICKE